MRRNEGWSTPEKPSVFQTGPRRQRGWILVSLLVLVVLALLAAWIMQRRPIEVVAHEPWEVADPGQPQVDPLRFEVLEEGAGPAVEAGDLIQVSLRWSGDSQEKEEDGWIWIGFQSRDKFLDPALLAAFIGQKEGGKLRFTESLMDSRSAGRVYTIPFGNPRQYAWRKGVEIKERWIYALGRAGYTLVRIEKVFKGEMKYRGIRLRDDNQIHRSPFQGLEKVPARNIGLMEARFDGVSADGRRATFQYGPWFGLEDWFWIWNRSDVLGAEDYRRMERWITEAWEKLPAGVQVE